MILKKITSLINEEKEFKRVYFWCKKSGVRVDFVLERLEKKSNTNFNRSKI